MVMVVEGCVYTLSQISDSASEGGHTAGVGITSGYKIELPSVVWAIRSTHPRDWTGQIR